jgi:hypothetical protein
MIWPLVAGNYLDLFESVRSKLPKTVPMIQPVTAAKNRSAVSGGPSK